MVLMEDEDVLPTKSLYIFLHECRALFHPSLPDQQRYRSLDPDNPALAQAPDHQGFGAWMVNLTGGGNQRYNLECFIIIIR